MKRKSKNGFDHNVCLEDPGVGPERTAIMKKRRDGSLQL